MWRLRVRPSQPGLRGPRESLPGPTTWVRPATGWWGRMNAGRKTLRNQGRTARALLSVSRRRSRGLRKNAAVERRKARRSALWTGSSLPLEGQVRSQDGPTGAAFRAREFRRSASLTWDCEGFETDNLARQPAGMRRAAALPHG